MEDMSGDQRRRAKGQCDTTNNPSDGDKDSGFCRKNIDFLTPDSGYESAIHDSDFFDFDFANNFGFAEPLSPVFDCLDKDKLGMMAAEIFANCLPPNPYEPGPLEDIVSTSVKGSKGSFDLSGACDFVSVPSTSRSGENIEKIWLTSPGRAELKTTNRAKEQEPIRNSENEQASDSGAWSLSPDESSAKSESENGYDSNTSETSVFTSSRTDLISRLMDEICTLFFSQASFSPRRHGEGTQSASNSPIGKSGTSVATNDQENSPPSQTRRKRTQKDDEDPDEANNQRKRRRTQDPNPFDVQITKIRCFACPFHKYDAPTYSNGNEDPRLALKYRSCGPPGWPTIGKMKEHLYRTHRTPIHCPRCWTIMKTEAALGEHARASSQCAILSQPLIWIPREVLDKLKNRKKAFAGQTDEDTWRYIYGLLFPDTANIPSPYYTDDTDLEELADSRSPTSTAIAAIEDYASAHLPRLVEEALETAVAQQTQPIEEGLRRALPEIVRDCHSRLTQNFLQYRSSSQDLAGVPVGSLPSFYIPPLDSTDDNLLMNLGNVPSNGQEAVNPPSDSGYGSGSQPQARDTREVPAASSSQNELDSFLNTSCDFGSSQPVPLDWDAEWLGFTRDGETADFDISNEIFDESQWSRI